jgi:hypothetical protein
MRSQHTDDEVSNLSFCRQTARNGYVFEFSFFLLLPLTEREVKSLYAGIKEFD